MNVITLWKVSKEGSWVQFFWTDAFNVFICKKHTTYGQWLCIKQERVIMNRNYQIKLFFWRETPPQSNCGMSRFIVVTVSLEMGWGERMISNRGLELQAASCRCFFHLLNCYVRIYNIILCTRTPTRHLCVNVLRTYFSFFIFFPSHNERQLLPTSDFLLRLHKIGSEPRSEVTK